jgi:hypothetical protein
MNVLNSPEYIDKIGALFPAQRVRLFSPKLTVSTFMAQALKEDSSCQKIVDEATIKQALNGRSTCSTNTGAYCKARRCMPLVLPSIYKDTHRKNFKLITMGVFVFHGCLCISAAVDSIQLFFNRSKFEHSFVI